MQEFLIPYQDLVNNQDRYTLKELGQKGYFLYKALGSFSNLVPRFSVISSRFFHTILEDVQKLYPKAYYTETPDFIEKLNLKAMLSQIPDSFFKPFMRWGQFKVAIRPSISSTKQTKASFTGLLPTFLGLAKKQEVIDAIIQILKVLFSHNTYLYLDANNLSYKDINVAIVVQQQMYPEVSGISYSFNPISNQPNTLAIEAVFGLGDTIANGEIVPDIYIVDYASSRIIEKKITPQKWMRIVASNTSVHSHKHTVDVELSRLWQYSQKLPDDKILSLATLTRSLAADLNQQILLEWGISGNQFYIFQIKPFQPKMQEQHTPQKPSKPLYSQKELKNPPLLIGTPLSKGTATGIVVKVLSSDPQAPKAPKKPFIVVGDMFTDDTLSLLLHPKCTGLLLDIGAPGSDAAVIAQDLAVPAIGNLFYATQILDSGQAITIDGFTGAIYPAAQPVKEPQEKQVFKPSGVIELKQSGKKDVFRDTKNKIEYVLITTRNLTKLRANSKFRRKLLAYVNTQKELDALKQRFVPTYAHDVLPIIDNFQVLSNVKHLFSPQVLADIIFIDLEQMTKKIKNSKDTFLHDLIKPFVNSGLTLGAIIDKKSKNSLQKTLKLFAVILIRS